MKQEERQRLMQEERQRLTQEERRLHSDPLILLSVKLELILSPAAGTQAAAATQTAAATQAAAATTQAAAAIQATSGGGDNAWLVLLLCVGVVLVCRHAVSLSPAGKIR